MENTINVPQFPQSKSISDYHIEASTQSNFGSPIACPHHHDYYSHPPSTPESRLPPLKQETQPVPAEFRKFGNAAPLGLCAFALTSFIYNCINLDVQSIQAAGLSVSLALNYGGIVQVLAGMWEMASGNTFGATTFCSFGAYWITFSLVSTLEPPTTTQDVTDTVCQGENLMGIFMLAWFIFTTLMLFCTLRSSIVMFSQLFFLDMNYLLLGIAHIECSSHGEVLIAVQKAAGVFGILSSFAAWYMALAGICSPSNGFFTIPLGHFPWSPAAIAHRAKDKDM